MQHRYITLGKGKANRSHLILTEREHGCTIRRRQFWLQSIWGGPRSGCQEHISPQAAFPSLSLVNAGWIETCWNAPISSQQVRTPLNPPSRAGRRCSTIAAVNEVSMATTLTLYREEIPAEMLVWKAIYQSLPCTEGPNLIGDI